MSGREREGDMRETIGSWAARHFCGSTQQTFILNEADRRARDKEEKQMARETYQRMVVLEIEREKNPIKCIVCSERDGKDVFFEGLSWFHCPKCGNHGFQSMNVSDCQYECTACWNMRRFGHN